MLGKLSIVSKSAKCDIQTKEIWCLQNGGGNARPHCSDSSNIPVLELTSLLTIIRGFRLRSTWQVTVAATMAAFEGKVIAITGAASGMGLATAQLLAERGATLSLADINGRAVEQALNNLSSNQTQHMCTAVDVRDSSAVDSWIRTTVEKYGRLDGAVNMAGVIKPTKPITEVTDDEWDMTFAVNVKGVFNCLKSQLRVLAHGGSIVSATIALLLREECSLNLFGIQVSAASVFGQFGAIGNSAYCANKAAVIGLTRTAAKENQFARVNCVSLGKVLLRGCSSSTITDLTDTRLGQYTNVSRGRPGARQEGTTGNGTEA
nr:short-chain dehydrogenase reductase 2a [Quercus suber]